MHQIINKFRFSTINENNENKMGEDFFKLLTKRNTKLSVGIGEVIVFITEGSIQDCYIPKFETNYPYKSGKWFILSNQPVCNIPGENLKYFYPFYSNEEQPSYNSIHPVTFDYKKKKDLYKTFQCSRMNRDLCSLVNTFVDSGYSCKYENTTQS